MTLHLIRHGKTIANDKSLYCGATDLPLSEAGISEIVLLKESKIYPKAQLYFVSGLLRTIETIELIYEGTNFITVEGLREINFGDFEMHGYESLKNLPEYVNWLNNPELTPPNGESFASFENRVAGAFDKVQRLCAEKSADSACIVTHGGVIASYMKMRFKKGGFFEWIPGCGRGWAIFPTHNGADYRKI